MTIKPKLRRAAAPAWFLAVAVAVTARWWAHSGYVWLLDSVWGPHQGIVWAHATANLAWQIWAHALSVALSAPIAEKLTLSLALWSLGLGGYYLARRLMPPGWSLAAGTLYMLNPFVYDRLLAGQWIVLAGAALLPVSLALASDALSSHGRRGTFRLTAVLVLYPLLSPHYAFINTFLLLGLLAVFAAVNRPAWLLSRRPALWLCSVIAAFLAVNWFWLAGTTGQAFKSFGAVDFATFRTASDPLVGVWGNVLGLYGFWRGPAFIQPKFWLGPVWLLIAAAVLGLSIAGAIRAWRRRQPLALTLAAAAPVALVLAVGYASPVSKPVTDLLMQILPGFRGLRDSSKFVGVLALAYAVLAPYGSARLAGRLNPPRTFARLAPAALVILAAVSVTGLIPGAAGQVPVANYPAGWTAAAARLAQDPRAPAAVLPWHNYLSLNFANNTYAAQPAPVLFVNPLLTSDEIDNVLAARPDTAPDRLMLAATSGQITPHQWAQRLRGLGARYIVLEKTDDWASYRNLVSAAGLTPVYHDSGIALYKL